MTKYHLYIGGEPPSVSHDPSEWDHGVSRGVVAARIERALQVGLDDDDDLYVVIVPVREGER